MEAQDAGREAGQSGEPVQLRLVQIEAEERQLGAMALGRNHTQKARISE